MVESLAPLVVLFIRCHPSLTKDNLNRKNNGNMCSKRFNKEKLQKIDTYLKPVTDGSIIIRKKSIISIKNRISIC